MQTSSPLHFHMYASYFSSQPVPHVSICIAHPLTIDLPKIIIINISSSSTNNTNNNSRRCMLLIEVHTVPM